MENTLCYRAIRKVHTQGVLVNCTQMGKGWEGWQILSQIKTHLNESTAVQCTAGGGLNMSLRFRFHCETNSTQTPSKSNSSALYSAGRKRREEEQGKAKA